MTLATKWQSFRHDRTPPGRALEAWGQFWREQTHAGHDRRTLAHFQRYAAELRVLFENCQMQRVLEIGCGDGALFRELGFDEVQYRGVDMSPAMLECFKTRCPGVDVVEADGSTYRDDESYDLIFSNSVIQYFDPDMVGCHFKAAERMLRPGGILVAASVLWRERRYRYCSGRYEDGLPLPRAIARHMRVALGMNVLGFWYNPPELEAIARREGLVGEFFGSMVGPYRFHVILRRSSN